MNILNVSEQSNYLINESSYILSVQYFSIEFYLISLTNSRSFDQRVIGGVS